LELASVSPAASLLAAEVLNKSCTFESPAVAVGLTSWAIADIEYG
jgi:hypothetical protein